MLARLQKLSAFFDHFGEHETPSFFMLPAMARHPPGYRFDPRGTPMKKLVASFALVLFTFTANAQEIDFHEELKEWVFRLCTEVQSALEAPKLDYESLEVMGRSDWAEFFMGFREEAIKEFGDSLGEKPNTWEQRAELYTALLRLCLATFMDK